MIKHLRRLGIMLGLVLSLRAFAIEDTHIGWIESIECRPAEWSDNGETRPKLLDAKLDHYRFLYPGEAIRCKGPGRLLIQDHSRLVTLTAKDNWYKLSSTLQHESNQEDEEALKTFGRIAGRPRGSVTSPIFSPANDGVVLASNLVVRWRPHDTPGTIRVRLVDEDGAELWQKGPINGSDGAVDSEELRQVLTRLSEDGRAGEITLILEQNGSAEIHVKFLLLSTENKKSLDDDLLRCASKQGLMHAACRAYAFESRRMWNDLAIEYDAALAGAPGSRDLTVAAILIHRKIGDTDVVDRLVAQLPPGTPVPD